VQAGPTEAEQPAGPPLGHAHLTPFQRKVLRLLGMSKAYDG
jgi:hypothetical protein